MPHFTKGVAHHCVGATGEISMPGKTPNIPAGNCRTGKGYCSTHQQLCEKHDWLFLRNQTCEKCDQEEEDARIAAEKKKKDDDDEEQRKKDLKDNKYRKKAPPKTPKTKTTKTPIAKRVTKRGSKAKGDGKTVATSKTRQAAIERGLNIISSDKVDIEEAGNDPSSVVKST